MRYEISLNGKKYEILVETAAPLSAAEYAAYAPAAPAPVILSEQSEPKDPVTLPAQPAVIGSGEVVAAPMPGTILKVHVTQGQAVKEGAVLVVLEAMKMEDEIMAPCAGTVTQLLTAKGASVDTGTPLVVIG